MVSALQETGVTLNQTCRLLRNSLSAPVCANVTDLLRFATDKTLHILSRPAESDDPRDPSRVEEVTDEAEGSPAPGTPKFTPQDESSSSSHILAYVSVLAAVVLGLLVYVAYKW